jgi:phospho-N-acetylmuramoyl-pentapeptide-transferase
MNLWQALAALVASFFIGMVLAPAFIRLSEKSHSGQSILSYVTQHKQKQGVPTMGGVVFILSAVATTLAFGGYRGTMTLVIMSILFAYGVIGFLDDFIKIKLKRNLGLRAYQKIISQLAIAVIAAFYCMKSGYIGAVVSVPAAAVKWNLGVWYVPFAAFVFIAMSNSVNLTDGLDGLAGTTNAIYFSFFFVIIALLAEQAAEDGNILYETELKYLAVFAASLIGGLMAFLWHNAYKAKMIMGDTGALALGGAAAAIALFVKNPLIGALIGVMFVTSAVSVIVQVASFKLRGKRVFLMSPFHHHLELKGYGETKIVAFYGIITAIAGIVSMIIL